MPLDSIFNFHWIFIDKSHKRFSQKIKFVTTINKFLTDKFSAEQEIGLSVDTPAAVSNTDMEETLPYTLSQQPSANADFDDTLNTGEENLKLSLDTAITPEQITNSSVANPDVVKLCGAGHHHIGTL